MFASFFTVKLAARLNNIWSITDLRQSDPKMSLLLREIVPSAGKVKLLHALLRGCVVVELVEPSSF